METEANYRIVELNKYYEPIESINRWTSKLFWFAAALSIIILYIRLVPWISIRNAITILFIFTVIVHLALKLFLHFYLVPKAEGKRRQQLLSNSFGVPLISKNTHNYYNNSLLPSVKKLGANVLENTFFAKEICGKMAVQERIKLLLYFSLWFISISWRDSDLDLIVIITQIVFSGDVLGRLLSLELLRYKNENIYELLYREFLNNIDFNSPNGIACIIDSFVSYETAKAVASIQQSSKLFNKMNPKLTSEWDNIASKLRINESE